MIEKLRVISSPQQIGVELPGPRELYIKINEIIDAVNGLVDPFCLEKKIVCNHEWDMEGIDDTTEKVKCLKCGKIKHL